jgi:copper transport protein
VAGAVLRFLAYAGTLIAAGGAAFLVLAHDRGPERPRLRRIVVMSAVVGTIGVLAALPVQAALATGEGFTAIFQDGVLGGVLEEGVGWSVLCTLVGLVLVVAADRHTVPVLIGALLASVGFALSGHSRSSDHELLAVGAAMAHLVAAAVWFGGLVLLAVTLRARRGEQTADGPRASATMVARFSTMAAVAVGVLTVAGLALTWSEVRAISALTSTTYGWTLLAKVGVAVLVGLAAAYNHFRLVPVVERAPAPRAWDQLRTSVGFEALGLVVVLALTGVLVNVTPARTEAGVGGIFSGGIDLGDAGTVNVVVDPNQAGTNQIHLYFYDPDGRPAEVPDGAEVTLDLLLPADEIGPITRTPFRAGPSHFQLDSEDLVTGGRWLIAVTVRSRFEEAGGEIETTPGETTRDGVTRRE